MLSLAADPPLIPVPDNLDIYTVIDNIIDFLFTALIAAAVIAILIAGFMFITAAGDPAKFHKAQLMVLYAIIGIVVAICSLAVTDFIRGVVEKTP